MEIDPNKTYRGNIVLALMQNALRQMQAKLAAVSRQRDEALNKVAELEGLLAVAGFPDIEFLSEEDRAEREKNQEAGEG